MQCDMFSIHLLHVVVLKNILHWPLKETNYSSISDDDRCDFTVIYSCPMKTHHSLDAHSCGLSKAVQNCVVYYYY